jgi:epoxyqueuosine reductase
MVVLIRNYHRRSFPPQLVGKVGRCYQVDERKEKGEDHRRIKDFFAFLSEEGIQFSYDGEIPARMAAARAGVATYGKNCFAYARRSVRGASWIESIPIVLGAEIEPDEPSMELGCPDWCRNACIAACPTHAIIAPKKMNPLRCIAYNSYYGSGITSMELREPMGIWVYGCDRCQDVCPRNQPWLNQELPDNGPLFERAEDFSLHNLLNMSQEHYENNVWPLTLYISRKNIAKWQMNAARAMGNSADTSYIPTLIENLTANPHEIVRGMCAWALGRLGGGQSVKALESRLNAEDGLVSEEIRLALEKL